MNSNRFIDEITSPEAIEQVKGLKDRERLCVKLRKIVDHTAPV